MGIPLNLELELEPIFRKEEVKRGGVKDAIKGGLIGYFLLLAYVIAYSFVQKGSIDIVCSVLVAPTSKGILGYLLSNNLIGIFSWIIPLLLIGFVSGLIAKGAISGVVSAILIWVFGTVIGLCFLVAFGMVTNAIPYLSYIAQSHVSEMLSTIAITVAMGAIGGWMRG